MPSTAPASPISDSSAMTPWLRAFVCVVGLLGVLPAWSDTAGHDLALLRAALAGDHDAAQAALAPMFSREGFH